MIMKCIPGYESLYAVDKDGVVFSYRMNDILVPVWKAPTGKINKRWVIELRKNGSILRVPIEDIVWETYKDCLDHLSERARIKITKYAREAKLI